MDKILVAIGSSEQSFVLEHACNLAKVFNAEIILLKVMEDETNLAKFFSPRLSKEVYKAIDDELQQLADETSVKTGLTINTVVAKGKVYEMIAEIAHSHNVILIMMGTNTTFDVKKSFIGTNTLRVIRESKIPVITIKGKLLRRGCKNIVLPLDLNKETKGKVMKTIEFAKLFGSMVRVVSVLLTNDDFIVNRLMRQLGQVKKFIEKEGVECTAEIIKGTKGKETVVECIIDYANKMKGDLIVIMTQQEVESTEFFIGVTAQEIINQSEIPVMTLVPTMNKDVTVFQI